MKVLIVFCALLYFIGVYSNDVQEHHKLDAEKETIDGNNTECASEHEIDLRMLYREMEINKDFTPTRQMQCFAACLLKKNGLMNPDGSLTRKYSDSAGAQLCKNLTGRDECGAAYKIMDCLIKHEFLCTGKTL